MASGWNLWVWLVSVVVRRYIIDILIIIITFPYTSLVHAQLGLQQLSCMSVCVSVRTRYSGSTRD